MPEYDVEVYPQVAPYKYTGEFGFEAENEQEARDLALQCFVDDFDEDYRDNGFRMFKFITKVKKRTTED